MNVAKNVIELIFSAALFLNAILFVPQALQIYKEKTAKGVSLITFLGFLIIQVAILLHAIITKDYILFIGYLLSLVTCGTVVTLIFMYRKNNKNTINDISLEDIIAQLPGHVYWKDSNCNFSGSNTNNWQDFGMGSLRDYVGKNDYDLFPKYEADQIRIVDEEVIREGHVIVVEELLTDKNGKKILYLSHKKPLKNKAGDIIGVLGCSFDITTSKQNTLDQLTLLDNIIAVMPGNVYWMNKEGIYLGCNDNEAKAVGLKYRKDIIGKRNVDIPGFVIPEALDPNNKQVFEKGETIISEEPATLPNGVQSIFLSHKAPIRDSQENIVGLVGISIDITERKKQEEELRIAKEEAEKSSKLKRDFISNMEHDIRTPFVGIYGMIDVLAKQETDNEKQSILNDVALCAKELMDYCDGILDFSKIESEFFPIVSKSFKLHDVVNSVFTIEGIAARNKQLNFKLEYDKKIPNVVMGDQYRLKRILINLLSNAIKFTNKGSVMISASLDENNSQDRQVIVKFVIEDTGIGIPDDKKSLVYERFSKIMPSNKGLYKGLGLGLRIVKQFVVELAGDIHLKSEVNKGTAFIVYLPFKIPLSDEIVDEE